MAEQQLIILSGAIQTGKTTALTNWVKNRTDTAGILTPVESGKRYFLELPGNNKYAMEAADDEVLLLAVGRFLFSAAHFERAIDYLQHSLQQPQWKYIIIDEVGPLELKQQKGFWPVLQSLLKKEINAIPIIVVRDKLLAEAAAFFTGAGYNVTVTGTAYFQL